jgi:hypothetical protein
MERGGQHHMSAALLSRQNHGTHLIGEWVGPRASVDNWEKIIANLRWYNTIRNVIDYFFFPRKRFVVFGRAEFKEYCILDEVFWKVVIRTRLQLFIFQGS